MLAASSVSVRPLSVLETFNLVHIFPQAKRKIAQPRIKPPTTTAGTIRFIENLQKSCGSLIASNNESRSRPRSVSSDRIVLSHQSVYDYLLSPELEAHDNANLRQLSLRKQNAHYDMAELCLAALLSLDSYDHCNQRLLDQLPFLRYAAEHWQDHYQRATGGDLSPLTDMAVTLLGGYTDPYVNWHRLCQPGIPARGLKWEFGSKSARGKDEVWGPVSYCAIWNLATVLERLLKQGEDPNEITAGLTNPIIIAARNDTSIAALRTLARHGSNINHVNREGRTALHHAILRARNPFPVVQELLWAGADLFCSSSRDGTPVHCAAWLGSDEVLSLLLRSCGGSKVANFEAIHDREVCFEFMTPLQNAAWNGRLTTLELLLDHGANIDRASQDLGTALHAAALNGQTAAIDFLLDKGADIDQRGGRLGSVFDAAAYGASLDTMLKVLERGSPAPNRKSSERHVASTLSAHEREVWCRAQSDEIRRKHTTTLQQAAYWGVANNAREILQAGADVSARRMISLNAPIHEAASSGHIGVVRVLLEFGANIDESNHWQWTPLHFASSHGHSDTVELLIHKGANREKRNRNSETPLSVALRKHQRGIADYLRSLDVGEDLLSPIVASTRDGEDDK
ncbi:MAG: hypothetical protein Q9162_004191 [Coniocarpon cinnabarinum]